MIDRSYDPSPRSRIERLENAKLWQVFVVATLLILSLVLAWYLLRHDSYPTRNIDLVDVSLFRLAGVTTIDEGGVSVLRADRGGRVSGGPVSFIYSDSVSVGEIVRSERFETEVGRVARGSDIPEGNVWITVRNAVVICPSSTVCDLFGKELWRITRGSDDTQSYTEGLFNRARD